MSICGKCIHYDICNEYVSPCETFPETDGCPCYKSKDDFSKVTHERWENNGNRYTCPVCKFFYFSNNEEWNFCPNCGAKMDGERSIRK